MIKASCGDKVPDAKTDQGYRYKVLNTRLGSIKELSNTITQQNTVIEGMVDDERQLQDLIPELAQQTSSEDKAQLLDKEANKNKVIDAAKQKYADQFDSVWEVMADELVGIVPKPTADLNSEFTTRINDKMGKDSIEDSFKARLNDWSLDLSLIGINDKDRIPARAFQLWGRHAGIDRQTIMQIYENPSKTPTGESNLEQFIKDLQKYCKSKIEYGGKPSSKIALLTTMEKELGSLETRLKTDVKNQKDENLIDTRNVLISVQKKTTPDKLLNTSAIELQRRIRGVISRRVNRSNLIEKQFTFDAGKTMAQLIAPLARPGHDGKLEAKAILHDSLLGKLDSDEKKQFMALVQDIIDDKLIGNKEILQTIQTKINGLQQSDLVGTTERVETKKIEYLDKLIEFKKLANQGQHKVEGGARDFSQTISQDVSKLSGVKTVHNSDQQILELGNWEFE